MMSFSLQFVLVLIGTFMIALVLTPLVRLFSFKIDAVDYPNARRINTKPMPSAGGLSIVIAFSIATLVFIPMLTSTTAPIKSYLSYTLPVVGAGWIIALTGLIDDVKELSAKKKMIGILLAASLVWFLTDFRLNDFKIPFGGPLLHFEPWLSYLLTVIWIVSITNAVNLIDGLDGLCGGISIIVLVTISLTSLTYGRTDISSLSLLLAGAIGGFLVYNFHPASVFLGDCGALFIGFMIAVISLLGFGYKSSSFFTLGAPIVVLMVPIMDTIIAIIRRKVHHKSFSEADKNHLHHKLMFSLELGQTKSVLILYTVTILFSLCSYIYLYDKIAATILFLTLMLFFEVFVEATNMIDRKYKPVLTIMNIFIKSEYLPSIKDTKPYRRIVEKAKKKYAVVFLIVVAIVFSLVFFINKDNTPKTNKPEQTIEYKEVAHETPLMSNIYNQLKTAVSRNKKEDIRQLVAAYFITDYFTLSNKVVNQIGGIDYFYTDKKDDFTAYAKAAYYKNVNTLITNKTNTQEVIKYSIISNEPSNVALSGLEDYSYYDIKITVYFEELNSILNVEEYTTTVTLIEKDQKFSVVVMEE